MFTKLDYDLLLQALEDISDIKHKEFHSGLVPNVDNMLGIPVPKLRAIAKKLVKECDDIEAYFSYVGNKYYEELMLCGIVIGCIKCEWNTRLDYIRAFIPKIYDWAVCDTFCSGIKPSKDELANFRKFIEPYLYSEKEFEIRFAVVILLQKYVNNDYISSTLEALANIKSDKYYVKMAVAWALSVCYIKYPTLTIELFSKYTLDKWVQNKAIQKCRESFRVSKEQKKELLGFKM